MSPSAVYQLLEKGKLVVHRVGLGRGAIRVSEADLEAFLGQCRSTAGGSVQASPPPRSVRLRHLRL